MALLGTLVDDFRDPTLDTAKWNAVNATGNAGFQGGGRYTFIVQQGATGDATLSSDVAYDLTGSHVHIELIDAGVQETGLEMYPIILTQNPANQDNALAIVVAGGLVGFYQIVAGVPTGLNFVAYNSTTMRWFRIRHTAGTAYFETASRVRGPWTVQASVVPTIAITALYMKARTFDYLSLSTAKQTAVSNVNYTAPPDVPFPNGALLSGVDVAFGADLAGDQTQWVWYAMDLPGEDDEDVVMDQTISTTRGRPNEASDVNPTASSVELDNPEGDLTPGNPTSQYWPNVDLGTPARRWIRAGVPRLRLHHGTSERAYVNHVTAYDITGDLDVRINMQLGGVATNSTGVVVAGVWLTAGNQRSWRLSVESGGFPRLQWSTAGTNVTEVVAQSPAQIYPSVARSILRATLDVNNGAGGWTVAFYLGETITGPWTQMGPLVTGSGVTSIFAANAPLTVGNPIVGVPTVAPEASIYDFQLRRGINGTLVADGNFSEQIAEVPFFVDPTGLAWNIVSGAELSDKWYRIVGTADSWAPSWPYGDLSAQQPGGLGLGEARTEIEIAGILRRIKAGTDPLESPIRRSTVVQSTLKAYWPMEDEEDSTVIASAIPDGPGLAVTGPIDFAEDDTLLGSKPLPELTATSSFNGTIVETFSGLNWQADFYIKFPSTLVTDVPVLNVYSSGTGARWIIEAQSGGYKLTAYNNAGVSLSTNAGSQTLSGWQHFRLMVRQNSGNVNWQLVVFPVTYPASVGGFLSGSFAGTTGGVTSVAQQVYANLAGISMGHLAIFDNFDLDAAANAAMGWMGETAVQRLDRLCTEEGILFRLIGRSSDTPQMGPQRVDTLFNNLDDAEDVDGGVLYEIPEMIGLVYRTRASMYNQPPNMVLDALEEQLQNPFGPILDDEKIRNDITVSRVKGSSVNVVDQPSIDKHGRYTDSFSLNLFSDNQLSDAAGWRLHQASREGVRYPAVSTNLAVAPEIINDYLGTDITGRVDVINLPPQHPDVTVDLVMEGCTEPTSPEMWKATMNCSAADIWDVYNIDGSWITDEYLFRAETDGSQLDDPIDDNDTSADVLVTDGPAWVTDVSEFPFDININGERVTVTAIGAASLGVQTFTITRSVNGVVRSHAAGTPIELWYQPVLAR